MMNDMETEVEMLRRQLRDRWDDTAKLEAEWYGNFVLCVTMSVCFVMCYFSGPHPFLWIFVVLGLFTDGLVGRILQSHFSKKYMSLANGR